MVCLEDIIENMPSYGNHKSNLNCKSQNCSVYLNGLTISTQILNLHLQSDVHKIFLIMLFYSVFELKRPKMKIIVSSTNTLKGVHMIDMELFPFVSSTCRILLKFPQSKQNFFNFFFPSVPLFSDHVTGNKKLFLFGLILQMKYTSKF